MTTTAQPLSTDQLIEALHGNLAKLADADERITPFTVIEFQRSTGLPTAGYTSAYNALHALHSSGLLHETHRPAVYTLRPDLPTSGNGHVWLRINNRVGAPVEVIGTQPRPADSRDAAEVYVRWTCHGCPKGHVSALFVNATTHVEEHASKCYGQALNT
ncbi:hypothetical protein ACFYXD_35170 [Streptomyces platensis]|uniref:hypothetical protein n=1 Tax=Streptomyces platensis TaxID=58346 RepID=UPI0036792C88